MYNTNNQNDPDEFDHALKTTTKLETSLLLEILTDLDYTNQHHKSINQLWNISDNTVRFMQGLTI